MREKDKFLNIVLGVFVLIISIWLITLAFKIFVTLLPFIFVIYLIKNAEKKKKEPKKDLNWYEY